MPDTTREVLEPQLDLRSTWSLISFRRRWVALLATVGLLSALGYAALRPAQPTAEALVLLPPTASSTTNQPTRSVATQAAIATSTPVLAAAIALKPVTSPVTVDDLRRSVHAKALTQDLLAVQVTAPRAADAERLANAVAAALVAYLNEPESSPGGRAAAQVGTQAASLATLVAQLHKLAAAAASSGDTALLTSIRDELSQVSGELDALANSMTTLVTSPSGTALVLQKARDVSRPSDLRIVVIALIGLAGGLVAGAMVAFGLSRRDRRLRFRRDVESTLGLPVLASLTATACSSPTDWEAVLTGSNRDSIDSWNLRNLLSHVRHSTTSPASVHVISFVEDRPAVAVGPALAAYSASRGLSTSLHTGGRPELEDLRAAASMADRTRTADPRLSVSGGDPGGDREIDVAVGLVGSDREGVDEGRPPLRSVMAVSSGFATADDVARMALTIEDRGGTVLGLVMVNPDPSDRTMATRNRWRDQAVAGAPLGPDADSIEPMGRYQTERPVESERTA